MPRKTILLLALLLCFTLPACLALAGEETRHQSGDFEYTLLEDGTAVIRRYAGSASALTIPDTLDGRPVSAVGDFALSGTPGLTGLTIPEGVQRIGAYAFAACDKLVSLDIREGVKLISSQAFLDCVSLVNLSIPDSVESIGGLAFSGCDSLKSVSIGSGVRAIGVNPFAGCDALTEISISPNHPALARRGGALYLMEDKSLVSYPGGLQAQSFDIPLGIERIGDGAFMENKNLTGITIPPSVTGIGKSAFAGCENLISLTIPDSVTAIGHAAFFSCPALLLSFTQDSYAHQYALANDIPFELAQVPQTAEGPQAVAGEEAPAFTHLADLAGLFTKQEARGLEEEMGKLYRDFSFDSLIVTTDDSQGMSARDYAIMFYERFRQAHETFPDAAVFWLHTDLNEYYQLTKGLGTAALTSQGEGPLLALVVPHLDAGSFGEGMFAWLAFVRESLVAAGAGE